MRARAAPQPGSSEEAAAPGDGARRGEARTCCTEPETLEDESVLLRFRRSLRSAPPATLAPPPPLLPPPLPPPPPAPPKQPPLPQPPAVPPSTGTRSGAASAAAASCPLRLRRFSREDFFPVMVPAPQASATAGRLCSNGTPLP